MNVVIIRNGVAGVAAKIIKEKHPETQVSIYTDESSQYYPRPRYC